MLLKTKGGWKIEESKVVYQNPWVTVLSETGIRPDGKHGEHAVVKYKPGVAVLPLDDEGNVYLNNEYRYAIDSFSIELVSGGIEKGDTDLQGAIKELKEELGIEAENFEDLGVYNPLTESIYAQNRLYIATGLKFLKSSQEGTEQIKVIKMPLRKAVKKVLSGEINFAIAALLILIAWEKCGKKYGRV